MGGGGFEVEGVVYRGWFNSGGFFEFGGWG